MPTTPALAAPSHTAAGPTPAPTATTTPGAQPDGFDQVIGRLTAAPAVAQSGKPAANSAGTPAVCPSATDLAAADPMAADPVPATADFMPPPADAAPTAASAGAATSNQARARPADKSAPSELPADTAALATPLPCVPPVPLPVLIQPTAPAASPNPKNGATLAASATPPSAEPPAIQPPATQSPTLAPAAASPTPLHQKDGPADDQPTEPEAAQAVGSPSLTAPNLAAPALAAPGLHSNAATAPGFPVGATHQSAAPPAASPSTQTAAAVSVLLRPGESAHQLTLRLDPAELGHLQITITRPKDAPPSVALTVERPETLLLLLRDQPALHRALDQAGVPADGRSVSFHLAAPSHDAGAQGDSGSFQGSLQNGSWQQGQQPQPGDQNHRQPLVAAGGGASQPSARASVFIPVPARQNWRRAGVDITA